MSHPKGVDLSHHNVVDGGSGFHGLYNAGIRFIFLKATQGTGFVDPSFDEYAQRIASMKNPDGSPQILLGAYHFGTGSNPHQQANHFLDTLKGHGPLVPALDWETNPQGETMNRTDAEAFAQRVRDVTGKWPLVYFSRSWPFEHGIKVGYQGALRNCPLWLASYRKVMPAAPAPWAKVSLWQYSSTGGVDLDEFCGDEAAMRAFWAKWGVTF